MIVDGKARSIGELVREVDRITRAFKARFELPEDIWFRGQSSAKWELLPQLYRSSLARFHYSETTLMDRFVSLATPLIARPPSSDWEWYFLARHHGVPSRLMDWTESLLAAVYFALFDHLPSDRLELDRQLQQKPEGPLFDERSPVIWILEARSLNSVALGAEAIVVPGGRRSAPYLPDNLAAHQTRANEKPIAVLPARANSRIVAQQGMFTVHGHERWPLDVLARRHTGIKLGRVVLDRSNVPQFMADLRTFGIHRVAMFPEPDSVASHVCWVCQSEVPITWRVQMAKKKSGGGGGSTIKKSGGKKRKRVA